jgi:phosphatidylinositol-3,4,5-trisphosphate 3-phosphatase and dual-specificity protein phosphatase PTEN
VHDGVDLDLSYITDHVIAMGYPSRGLEALYRNQLGEVKAFLERRHGGHFRIWNLVAEREYGSGHFPCQIERFTWADHTPPPLALVRGGGGSRRGGGRQRSAADASGEVR